jgi:hypothetical protein
VDDRGERDDHVGRAVDLARVGEACRVHLFGRDRSDIRAEVEIERRRSMRAAGAREAVAEA